MSNVTVTTTDTVVEVNIINGVAVYYSGMDIERLEEDADFTYEFPDEYMIDKILVQCLAAGGATVSIEKLADTGDIMFPITLALNEWTSVTMDIYPADIEDSDDTTIYFKTTGTIKVIIYKRLL